jgi:outer membrane protein assembly factor BamB
MTKLFVVPLLLTCLPLACSTNSGGSSGGTAGKAGVAGASGAAGHAGANGGGSGTSGAAGTGGATAGASGSAGQGGIGGAGASGDAGTSGSTGTGGAASGSVSVLMHHNNLQRTGVYVDRAFMNVASPTIDTTFANAKVTGNVYAQPLYLAGANGGPDLVIVATEMNNVYAFNAATGAQVWTSSVGTPASRPTSGGSPGGDLPCGGITPNVGVTGTPVIDASTRIIYLDAMTIDTSSGSRVVKHMVNAVDADTGNVHRTNGWPVDLNASATSGGMAFQSSLQNQRAALTLVNGTVFVPFSGHIGDCGGYHGWIVGVTTLSASGPPTVSIWATRAIAGGIWGSSGIASDGTSLFFATGNSKAMASDGPSTTPSTWGDGETVYKFATTLTPPSMTSHTDLFVPSNWMALDKADQDIGGTSPILVDVQGASPSSLIVALGKDGNAYLLDRTDLGGMDAQPLAETAVVNSVIINAAVTYTTLQGTTYVVFRNGANNSTTRPVTPVCPSGETGGLSALRISATTPPAISVAWCGGPSPATGNGSPAVSMTDTSGSNTLVWVVGGDNKLYAVDGDTGANVVTSSTALSAVQSIQTPIVANGRIFVASNSQVYAVTP